METKHLFPTPLWIEDNCGLDLNRITRWVDIVWEEDTIGRAASNDGGWQSQDFVPPYICDDHALTELYNKIIATAYNCADDFGFKDISIIFTITQEVYYLVCSMLKYLHVVVVILNS